MKVRMLDRIGAWRTNVPLFRTLYLSVIFWVFAAAPANGQAPISDGPAPPGIAPGSPDGSYHLSTLESVNLFNGNLNVYVPITLAHGRGKWSLPLGVSFVTRWEVQIKPTADQTLYYPQPAYYQLPVFSPGRLLAKLGVESTTCDNGTIADTATLLRFEFTEADGTTHELRDAATNGAVAFTEQAVYTTGIRHLIAAVSS
jgi:hypothetical protein